MVNRPDSKPYWLIYREPRTGQFVVDHVHGADRIRTGHHVSHAEALRQAQMLMSASEDHPVVDRA